MKIRSKIFETNSSSSHSFVLHNTPIDYEIPAIQAKEIEINCSEFGWGPERLTTWLQKAEYLATYAALYGPPGSVELFESVMSDCLKVNVKVVLPREDSYEAYIDHQSINCAAEMFKDIKRTIFAKEGIIFIDNDNDLHYEE